MIEFIFMLTHNDATVERALDVLDEVSATGLRYVGFKDVGAPPRLLREITAAAHDLGMEVMLELVTTDSEAERESLRNAEALGVDWILGGTQPEVGTEVLRGTAVRYCPFPGTIEGHPSVLKGSIEEIAGHAHELTSREGVYGVDLLAYRHETVDHVALTRAVVEASDGPVIVAGSISTLAQIEDLDATGAWAFTIGGAIFDGRFAGAPSIARQVETVLRAVDPTPA